MININGLEILATPNPVCRIQTVLLDKPFISLPRRYASVGIGAQEGASPYCWGPVGVLGIGPSL
jgi:hypothetical protein